MWPVGVQGQILGRDVFKVRTRILSALPRPVACLRAVVLRRGRNLFVVQAL